MRRTRPVTRGSGTWRKGNNDRSSNRPPRSSSIKKPGDINTILQTVLDRLNDLDKRFNDLTKKPTPTQTNNKITPLLDLETIPQPQTARSEIATAKSINPDFGQLWRCLFKGVQLKHHRNNWETTPLSICKRLEDMGEFITPPTPNPETSKQLKTIMQNTGNLIRDCVLKHIDNCISQNRNTLSRLNSMDKNKAFDIAHKHLKKRLGTTIKDDFIINSLTEEFKFLTNTSGRDQNKPHIHSLTRPTDDEEAPESTMEWTTVVSKAKNKKRPPPANTPNSPHTTRNIATLKELDQDVEPTDSEPEYLTPSQHPSSKRPRKTTTPLIPSKPKTNQPETNGDTPITYDITRPPPDIHTMVVADSNLSQLTDEHIPTGWYLAMTRGLNIPRTIQILKNLTIPADLKRIIIATGINDREINQKTALTYINDLKQLMTDRKKHDDVSIIFSKIAFGPSLPQDQLETLEFLNNEALSRLPDDHVLNTIPTQDIINMADKLHYTKECALRVWHKIIEEVSELRNTTPHTKN